MRRVPQVVVGLGNPGPAYRGTRHSLGHAVVDHLAERLRGSFRDRGPSVLAEVVWAGEPLYLAKPLTFMNTAGPAVARLLRDLAVEPAALVVVHDDLDLPFGRVRIREKGRHGGHNGVRSLIDALGTEEFRRVKIGIGRPLLKVEVADWVLSPFSREERDRVGDLIVCAADAVVAVVGRGGRGVAGAAPRVDRVG